MEKEWVGYGIDGMAAGGEHHRRKKKYQIRKERDTAK